MSVDLTPIQKATYGAGAFNVRTYDVQSRAIVKDGIGRIGSRTEVTLEGEYTANDPASFSSGLLALVGSLEQDGLNFAITGLNGVTEFQMLAAQCLNGAPHVDYELNDGPAGLTKNLKLRIWAERPTSGSQPLNSYKSTTATRADGLRTLTWDGEVNGANGVDFFLNIVVPTFKQAYADAGWVKEFSYTVASQQFSMVKVQYRATARQTFGPLPATDPAAVGAAASAFAVDGTASVRVDRDEQMRKTSVYDFDLLVVGDPMALLTQIRPDNDGYTLILRESVTTESIKENRLRASFTILESGDNTALMNWNESIRISYPGRQWEEKTYPGVAPILVQRPQNFGRIVQTGAAIAAGKYKKQPPPAYNYPEHPSEVTFTNLNEVEKQTAWNYQHFLTDANGNPLGPQDLGTTPVAFMERVNQDDNFIAVVYPQDTNPGTGGNG